MERRQILRHTRQLALFCISCLWRFKMQGCLKHSYRYKHFVLKMPYIARSSIVIHFALAIPRICHLTAGLAFPVRHSKHSVCLLLCLFGWLVFFVLINICTYLNL